MRYFLWFLVTLNLFAVDATLKIEKDVESRAKMAVVDGSSAAGNIGDKFFNTLISDLTISGHFLPDATHHMGSTQSGLIDPMLKSKEYVLKYTLSQVNGLTATVKLYRGGDASLLASKEYNIATVEKYPFLAHKIVSELNDILKYPEVNWLNRYVIFSRYTTAKRSVIVVADYTMQYQKIVIQGGLNLFPKWADQQQSSFYYTSFNGTVPTLYRLNIYNGSRSTVVTSQGMLVCSDVSQDGSRLLLTMAPNAQPDVFEMGVGSNSPRQITTFAGIDVGGKYMGGDQSIVFVSNRMGYANIFKQSLFGNSVSQVVFHGRDNNAVDAHGEKIVYSSKESQSSFGSGNFNLYLTDSSGSDTRPLTTSGVNQFPRFSTNGNAILYTKLLGNKSSVGYINLESKQSLLFPLGGKVQSIDW